MESAALPGFDEAPFIMELEAQWNGKKYVNHEAHSHTCELRYMVVLGQNATVAMVKHQLYSLTNVKVSFSCPGGKRLLVYCGPPSLMACEPFQPQHQKLVFKTKAKVMVSL